MTDKKTSQQIADILSDLKREIHNKAVFTNIKGVDPYVTLKTVDAIIATAVKKYMEKR